MLAVLRTEQKNPASYWSWLSQDVLNHYLVNQYTFLWVEQIDLVHKRVDYGRTDKQEVVVGTSRVEGKEWIFMKIKPCQAHPVCLVQLEDVSLLLDYYPTKNGYIIIREPKQYLFDLGFRLSQVNFLNVSLPATHNGELIEVLRDFNHDRENQKKLNLMVHSLETGTSRPLEIDLPSIPSFHYRIDHGLIYVFDFHSPTVWLYSLETGSFLTQVNLSGFYSGFIQVRIDGPARLALLSSQFEYQIDLSCHS